MVFVRSLVLLVLLVVGTTRLARAEEPPALATTNLGEDVVAGSVAPELGVAPDPKLYGKTIRAVKLETVGGRWPIKAPITSVRPGEALASDTARRVLRELLAGGLVARATVDAAIDGDGVVLLVRAVPRRTIASVRIRGGELSAPETIEAAKMTEGTEITAMTLPVLVERVQHTYAQHGYPFARASVDTGDTDDPQKVVLVLDITAGPALSIAQRIFVIDPKADLEVGELKKKYKYGQGSRFDEPKFAEADRELTETLRERGFARAEVKHATQRTGTIALLYVFVNPGPRLEPVFDGNRAFDADELRRALALDKAAGAKIPELVEKLRAYYVARGFYDVEVRGEERGRPDEFVHYLAFAIHEHPQVRVVRRVFPCLGPEFSPDNVGSEIESFLEEELPGADPFTQLNPSAVGDVLGTSPGKRANPVDLNPAMTYAPETYDRAIKHLRDLFHSKGYLNVFVGQPVVVRATCSKRSPPGQCIPEPMPGPLVPHCPRDDAGLPLPEPPVPEGFTCRSDPAHDVWCSPEITLRIPVNLGPQTILYDLAFDGNKIATEKDLAKTAELVLGDPISNVELEAARNRVLDFYRNSGYAYAEVRFALEPSPDRTRARVRFSITERDQTIVTGFVIRGNTRTSGSLILGRLELKKGEPYKQDWARTSEEQIATLGTFSSVALGLEDPEVPQRAKRVIITVVEQLPQYLSPRLGFSTGDGIRAGFQYGHRNIAGEAVALTLSVQLNYLFDFMIIDPSVRANYATLSASKRLERTDTLAVTFPEVGLGPRVSLEIDAIDVRDNQRDFGISKEALVPTLSYRPRRTIVLQAGGSVELNDVGIFNEAALNDAIALLRVPEGSTVAVSQQFTAAWDRRDNSFAATRGTFITGSIEHVSAYPSDIWDNKATIQSNFIKFSGRMAGYVRFTNKGTALAVSLAAGYNFQLTPTSQTYPDRLFFMGGVDSLRSFLQDYLVPEDVAQKILHHALDANGLPLTVDEVPLRGGDVSINPRAELRIPLNDLFSLGVFLDAGNIWVDPASFNAFTLRYALGAGLRITTPIGPIAFDYGIDMGRRPWEDFGAFHFSIGLF